MMASAESIADWRRRVNSESPLAPDAPSAVAAAKMNAAAAATRRALEAMPLAAAPAVEPARTPVSAAPALPEFEYSTPMLVMPFDVFKAQGRICKSTQEWRSKAFAAGWLLEHSEHVVSVFVSHRWWWQPAGRPRHVYDWGGPDYPEGAMRKRWRQQRGTPPAPMDDGRPVFQPMQSSAAATAGPLQWVQTEEEEPAEPHLKHRLVCEGVEQLIEAHGLPRERVAVWIDWQSIHQDDAEVKMRGVRSLIRYTTLCEFMLCPVDAPSHTNFPYELADYGQRAWCRCEFFIFSLWAAIKPPASSAAPRLCRGATRTGPAWVPWDRPGAPVQLYAIHSSPRAAMLEQFPEVMFDSEEQWPSCGTLTNPADRAAIVQLQETIVAAYAKRIGWTHCAQAQPHGGGAVLLNRKMLRAEHALDLGRALAAHRVEVCLLHLGRNHLGDEGVVQLLSCACADGLKGLERIYLMENGIGERGMAALATAVRAGALPSVKILEVRGNPGDPSAVFEAVAEWKQSAARAQHLASWRPARAVALLPRQLAGGGRAARQVELGNLALQPYVMQVIGPMLAKHGKGVRRLALHGNRLGDDGVAHLLSKSADGLRGVRTLNLASNGIRDKGMRALAAAVAAPDGVLAACTRVILHGNPGADAPVVAALAAKAQQNHQLGGAPGAESDADDAEEDDLFRPRAGPGGLFAAEVFDELDLTSDDGSD